MTKPKNKKTSKAKSVKEPFIPASDMASDGFSFPVTANSTETPIDSAAKEILEEDRDPALAASAGHAEPKSDRITYRNELMEDVGKDPEPPLPNMSDVKTVFLKMTPGDTKTISEYHATLKALQGAHPIECRSWTEGESFLFFASFIPAKPKKAGAKN